MALKRYLIHIVKQNYLTLYSGYYCNKENTKFINSQVFVIIENL